jgi:hypothetical protein
MIIIPNVIHRHCSKTEQRICADIDDLRGLTLWWPGAANGGKDDFKMTDRTPVDTVAGAPRGVTNWRPQKWPANGGNAGKRGVLPG